jgi:mRNA-degrading endonuclease RelE of RelBE toxin-antitoxin system
MYEVLLTNTANKSQKNLDKPLRAKILESLEQLANEPENSGEKLVSPLTNFYSHHIKYKGREVRIAYTIELENKVVFIHLIGFHENFYKKLKAIIDK